MDKKTVSSKTKSRQDANEPVSKDFEKELKKSQREETQKLNAELKKIAKLDFEGFKKAMIAQLKFIHKGVNGTDLLVVETTKQIIKWAAENRDKSLEIIAEKLNERDELITEGLEWRDERFNMLAGFLYLRELAKRERTEGKLSENEKSALAEIYGVSWEESQKDEINSLLARGRECQNPS